MMNMAAVDRRLAEEASRQNLVSYRLNGICKLDSKDLKISEWCLLTAVLLFRFCMKDLLDDKHLLNRELLIIKRLVNYNSVLQGFPPLRKLVIHCHT